MNPLQSAEVIGKSNVITHSQIDSSLEKNIDELTRQIVKRGDLPHTTKNEQLKILRDLASFPLGQFLIKNRGLNGYWTDYILMHPKKGRVTNLNDDGKPFSDLEEYILNRAPTVLATQERFTIFQQELQKLLNNDVNLASIPSGLMSDLLTLDFSEISNCTLYGVDIDPNATFEAQKKVQETQIPGKMILFEDDAWNFCLPDKVDVITSNGLNIYEHSDARVVQLYRQFYENLKPGGSLIISFLTPPPGVADELEWKFSEINSDDARLQKIIFADILNASWQAYRPTKLTIKQLKEAGFTDIQIIPDKAGIFPTAVARRPN